MSRVCTICRDPRRAEINEALATKAGSYRQIAERFSLNISTVFRHEKHVPAYVAKGARLVDLSNAEKVGRLMEETASGAKRLYDACEEWLRDPENPEKYYLGPRGEDIWVLLEWTTLDVDGKAIRHRSKDLLHNIIQKIEDRTGRTVTNTSWKHADPRELILKASANLKDLIDTIVKIQAEAREQRRENLMTDPTFIKYQAAVLSVLTEYAGAVERLEAVARPIIAGAQRDLPLDGAELGPRPVTSAILELIEQTLKGGEIPAKGDEHV